jgi:antibiotic biosynthesis monooxygenase (ABM) superfamily enzyme
MAVNFSFDAAWADYRRRRQFFGVWLGGFPVAIAIVKLLPPKPGEFVFSILSVLLIAAFVVVAIRLLFFRCPRCGNTFFLDCLRRDLFSRRCIHCGLPKWAHNDQG